MTKAPRLGYVKSRLGVEIGVHHALGLYRCFLLDMVKILAELDQEFIVYFTPGNAESELLNLLGKQEFMKQVGENLGERLFNGLEMAYIKGYTHAVALASDVPDISHEYLVEVVEMLKIHDGVIGPSTDGGYNLIGFELSKNRLDYFSGIKWGTERVFEDTMRRLKGLLVHVMPFWRDIDDMSDLKPVSYTHLTLPTN